MMARAHPQFALRPFLIEDTPLLAEIFRASIEELAATTTARARGKPGPRRPTTRKPSPAARRAAHLDRHDGRLAGRLCVAREQRDIDLLYVHPAVAGQGAGTMLVDALEKLAAARGAKRLTADVSDTAQDFFKKARLLGRSSATPSRRRRMARQHHDGKTALAGERRMTVLQRGCRA